MEGNVELDVSSLSELLRRLKEKRGAVEKELGDLGQPPAEMSELLRLCQGFERAFSTSISSLETAFYIKEAFLGETGLAGTLRKLPIEKRFDLRVIKAVVREADGYQPHLVSPEKGLRRLVDECIQMAKDPVITCVDRVYSLMVAAAADASKKALSTMTAIEAADLKASPRMPGFERTVTNSAQQALEAWKKDAMTVAVCLVEMESDYITSAYFRRAIDMRAQMVMDSEVPATMPDKEDEEDEDEDDDDEETTDEDEDESPRPKKAPSRKVQGEFDPNDLKAGYLEKRIGEGSGRGAIPVDSWKWQKRWFIFTDTKAMLYYFKSPDDPPNYRGAVNIRECVVEDLDARGNPRSEGRGGDAGPSLLIRISSKDPNRAIIKKHHTLVLRAPSPGEKAEWFSRLRKASGIVAARRAPPTQPKLSAKKGQTSGADEDGNDVDYYKYSSTRPMLTIAGRDTFNIGIGTALPFSETALKLAPIPPWKYLGFSGLDPGDKYEAYLEQLGRDCCEYTRVILDTLVTEVPKSVVHCLVERSKKEMLAQLYNCITTLQPWEISSMMEEDHATVQRRAATSEAIKDIDGSISGTEKVIAGAPKKGKVLVPRKFIDLADMWDMVERPPSAEPRAPYGEYTPAALRSNSFGKSRPSISVSSGAAASGVSPKEVSPVSSTSDPPTRPATPPTAGVAPPPAGQPAGPSPKPRRRPPPAPPTA